MNRTNQYILAIVFCSTMAPSLESSAKSSGGHSKRGPDATLDGGRSADAGEDKWERDPVVFCTSDRDAIRSYYLATATNLSPGPAKNDASLPPGLRRHLQRNGILPPGLQKRIEPLARKLERRLRPLYSGYSRGTIGQDVVLVEDRTLRVMDIIWNVTGGADSTATEEKD